jgi:hypothetical protein
VDVCECMYACVPEESFTVDASVSAMDGAWVGMGGGGGGR